VMALVKVSAFESVAFVQERPVNIGILGIITILRRIGLEQNGVSRGRVCLSSKYNLQSTKECKNEAGRLKNRSRGLVGL